MTDFAEPIGLTREPHPEQEWTDDGNKYRLPHPDKPGEILVADRASELGKVLSDTFTLNRWHQRQVVKGMTVQPSLRLDAARAMTLDRDRQRLALQDLANRAMDAAKAKEPASLGTGLHGVFELLDAGLMQVEDVPHPWHLDALAYVALLDRMSIRMVPEYSEEIIWVRELNIVGRFDRLVKFAPFGPDWVVLDLKSGFDLQYSWHEIAVQELVYGSANLIFDPETETWSPAPRIRQDRALVLHIPSDHDREPRHVATLFEVDISQTVDLVGPVSPARLAVAVKEWRRRKVSRVLFRLEVTEDGEVVELDLSWAERIALAMSPGDLEVLEDECRAAGEWHGGLTDRRNRRLQLLST